MGTSTFIATYTVIATPRYGTGFQQITAPS